MALLRPFDAIIFWLISVSICDKGWHAGGSARLSPSLLPGTLSACTKQQLGPANAHSREGANSKDNTRLRCNCVIACPLERSSDFPHSRCKIKAVDSCGSSNGKRKRDDQTKDPLQHRQQHWPLLGWGMTKFDVQSTMQGDVRCTTRAQNKILFVLRRAPTLLVDGRLDQSYIVKNRCLKRAIVTLFWSREITSLFFTCPERAKRLVVFPFHPLALLIFSSFRPFS